MSYIIVQGSCSFCWTLNTCNTAGTLSIDSVNEILMNYLGPFGSLPNDTEQKHVARVSILL